MVGFFGIAPYVLPPYATLRTPARTAWPEVTAPAGAGRHRRHAAGPEASVGVIGFHEGWRIVYALAAVAMLLLLWPLRRTIADEVPATRTGYLALMRSVGEVFRTVPLVRWSALSQGLATGSFTTLWVGISLYMQGPVFGWRSDGVGGLALIGAAATVAAPFVGGFADRGGPRFSLLAALSLLLASWGILALLGHAIVGIVAGMIFLDLGATAADISNRTVIFSLRPDIRTRLATIYMIGKFGGGGIAAWLTGIVWSAYGWPGVCGLGGALAGMAALTALLRICMPSEPG